MKHKNVQKNSSLRGNPYQIKTYQVVIDGIWELEEFLNDWYKELEELENKWIER